MAELMAAIEKSQSKRVQEILEENPSLDVNELVEVEMFNDKFKWAPLHAAAYYGDVKICQALIQRGADVELNDTWYHATPVGWAAFGGNRFFIPSYDACLRPFCCR